MNNDTTLAFVRQHRTDDVRRLALEASRYSEVDIAWALNQIAGWQAAREKIPSWAASDAIIYPPHLNMEQCSSEATARYKANIAKRLLTDQADQKALVDLTGGFGVDFSFMAEAIAPKTAFYVEQNVQLSAISSENFKILGLSNFTAVTGDGIDFLRRLDHAGLIYLDPARRDEHGGKTYAISDCTPDVLLLLDELTKKAHFIVIKLSPMLDWHKAVNEINAKAGRSLVSEVHVLSVRNECKELLLVLSTHAAAHLTIICANDDQIFRVQVNNKLTYSPTPSSSGTASWGPYLYEPNASVMKAGIFDKIADFYHLLPISVSSHLFVATDSKLRTDFPGRKFQISAISSMNRHELKTTLEGLKKANITVRNFPLSASDLRKRLKLSDGGDDYLFGTTLADGRHVIIRCKKA